MKKISEYGNESCMRLPCMICESADPYSSIICENCECSIDQRKETFESMVSLVMDLNSLGTYSPSSLTNKVYDRVKPIYDSLVAIKIEETRDES